MKDDQDNPSRLAWWEFFLPLAVYGIFVRRFWFVCDDAFISFRYARHWAEGHGLRYNLSSDFPVEGYSNFLWVALAAVGERMGFDSSHWVPWVSVVAGASLVHLVQRQVRCQWRQSPWVALVPALFLATSPSFTAWASSGLETMGFALLFYVVFHSLVLAPEVRGVRAGMFGILLVLIRAEGFLWAGGLGVLAALSRLLRKQRVSALSAYLILVALGWGAHLWFRQSYYGEWWPNTVRAKAAFSAEIAARGVDYVSVFVLTVLTPLLFILAVGKALWRGGLAVAGAVASIPLAFYAYAIIIGGDFMCMGRFLLPGLAFEGLLLAWLAQSRSASSSSRGPLALIAIVALLHGLPAADVHLVPKSVREQFHFRTKSDQFLSEAQQWEYMADNGVRWSELGRRLAELTEPEESLVCGAIGAVGYYSGLEIFDVNGLVSPEVARRPTKILRAPGHDKAVPRSFFLDRNPTYVRASMLESEDLAGEMQKWLKKWRHDKLSRHYVPAGQSLPPFRPDDPPRYLAVLKRSPPGVDPFEQWDLFTQQVLVELGAGERFGSQKKKEQGKGRRRKKSPAQGD